MKTHTLRRELKLDYGTFGVLDVDGVKYQTVELPWKDNQRGLSCVPAGRYVCALRKTSVNHAAGLDIAFELQDVPGRSHIEIHVANYPRDVQGCIGLGVARAFVGGQYMVTCSRDAIRTFYAAHTEPFILEITE